MKKALKRAGYWMLGGAVLACGATLLAVDEVASAAKSWWRGR